jgi:CubicO group peptidase (beta-lactamase class C family)
MRAVFLILILFIPLLSFAQMADIKNDNSLYSKIDSSVHKHAMTYMSDEKTVGLSIGIISGNKKYHYNYGEVKKGTQILPTSSNFYGIGSIDKTFATLLLANAVTEKKVNLDDDIRTYLPEEYPNLSFAKIPVTFKNLANHTSGLPRTIKIYPKHLRDSLSRLSFANQVEFYGSYSRDSLLTDLHLIKLDTIPGAKYQYNNNDVSVLILLLELIYENSYEKILTNYLSTNLSMNDTKTALSEKEKLRAAAGYFRGEFQEFQNLKGFYTGFSVMSTINDMLRYLDVQLHAGTEVIQLVQQLTWGNENGFGMGLGWMIDYDSDGHKYIYHSGNTRLGYNSMCLFYPGLELGLVIFANDTNDLQKVGDLVSKIKNDLSNEESW